MKILNFLRFALVVFWGLLLALAYNEWGAGNGLGLSISHGIIEDHGNRIDINSFEGCLTKVTIELPIA